MGLIKAFVGAVGGGLADQWLEVVEPQNLAEGVIFTKGVLTRRGERSSNTKGSEDIISDGSTIHVPENTAMLLVDGGKIVDISAEAGYFKVSNASNPSIFSGRLGDAIKETFNRFRFGGETPYRQRVFYVNLQELRNIKFGTSTPLMYNDANYNLDLEVRTHGHYSVKVVDPILFYKEVVSKDDDLYTIERFNEQFHSEFMEALQVSIANLSIEGVRLTHLPAKQSELSSHMDKVLDEKWKSLRGLDIISVAVNAITYTEDSKAILAERNKGAVLSDPSIREGYVQGSIARGFENAGKNEAGAGNTFIGMGMGMNAAGGMFGEMSRANNEQIRQKQESQTVVTNSTDSVDTWHCDECDKDVSGKFCSECGSMRPERQAASFCSECGLKFESPKPKFCPNCGTKQS